jgi:hypothetical protein
MSGDGEVVATSASAAAEQTEVPEVTFAHFLEEIPPETYVKISDLKTRTGNEKQLQSPPITLFCNSDSCDGPLIFDEVSPGIFREDGWRHSLLIYKCRNCRKTLYNFSIFIHLTKVGPLENNKAKAIKLGQVPSFGTTTPARLLRLIQRHRELFLQGRRAENKGLGIGAFAYYRRVVENEKNHIIAEIAKVAKVLGSNEEIDGLFAAAQKEISFTKSVEKVKDVIPETLLINGQNPLTLLHSALSKGLHDPEMTDEHCLRLAHSIRTVLFTLTEKASEALKNDKDIQAALNTLMAVPSSAKAPR